MPKENSALKPEEHPVAAAIGRTLGRMAKMTGLAHAPVVTKKERLPRKHKKARKKQAAAAPEPSATPRQAPGLTKERKPRKTSAEAPAKRRSPVKKRQ